MHGIRNLHTTRGWVGFFVVAALLLVAVPVLNALPETNPLHVPDWLIPLAGKFCCYALVALAMDLIWGYTGILSLGHGVYFALGGYAMGMYLMRSMAGEGVYRSELPDFMVFLNWKELPWFWHGFEYFPFALLMALAVPGLLAFVFGWFAFRSRIKGVYFSIITQAMTFALMLLFFRNETGFGGNNGLTDFKRLLGFTLSEPSVRVALYWLTALVLLGVLGAVDHTRLQCLVDLGEGHHLRQGAERAHLLLEHLGRLDAHLLALEVGRRLDRRIQREGLEAVVPEDQAADALGLQLGQQLLADRTLGDLVQVVVVVEDEGQVEDLEFLDAERAELGQRRGQRLHGAELQRLHFFLVLVQRRVGIDLDLDLALGQLFRLLGEILGG